MSQTSNPTGGDAVRARQSAMMNAGRSLSGHEKNCAFLNTGASEAAAGRFANVSAISGLGFDDDARAFASTDWDHDGDLDLWISNRNAPRLRFLRNDTLSDSQWIALRLIGGGEGCNRDAIGARIEVVTDGSRAIRTVKAGEGFLSQSAKWVHFGLGDSKSVEKIVVRWPDREGTVEVFSGIESNGRYLLSQGSGRATLAERRKSSVSLKVNQNAPLPPSRIARVPLVTLFPFPDLPVRDLERTPYSFTPRKPRLVNLWASWCAPCLDELAEFTEHADELRAAGLEILALSVDGLGDGAGSEKGARLALEKIEWPFSAGMATDQVVRILQDHHNALIALNRPLPVPTSFLIDEKGRLSVIYKGPVSVETVLSDLKHSAGAREDRWVRAAPIPGSTIDDDHVRKTADNIESIVHFRNGLNRERMRDFRSAFHHYTAALQHRPKFPEANRRLGNLFLRQEDWEAAARQYQAAIAVEPDEPATRFALGDAYFRSEKFDEAAEQYRKVLEINPQHHPTYLKLAQSCAASGRKDEALETVRRGISVAEAAGQAQFVERLKFLEKKYQPLP